MSGNIWKSLELNVDEIFFYPNGFVLTLKEDQRLAEFRRAKHVIEKIGVSVISRLRLKTAPIRMMIVRGKLVIYIYIYIYILSSGR